LAGEHAREHFSLCDAEALKQALRDWLQDHARRGPHQAWARQEALSRQPRSQARLGLCRRLRRGDVANAKAQKELGWTPKVGFRELIQMMVQADEEDVRQTLAGRVPRQ